MDIIGDYMLEVILQVNRCEIDRLRIVNDGTGTDNYANYIVIWQGEKCRIVGHDRNEGAWALLHQVLDEVPTHPNIFHNSP